MRILVLYGTSEGQTAQIASFVADRLRQQGEDVVLVDVLRPPPGLRAGDFDAAIVAARVHAGRYQRQIVRFGRENRDALDAIPNAFLSVSMSAADLRPGDMERAEGYVRAFVRQAGWRPHQTLQVAGARLYTRHNALGRWILGLVDRKALDTTRDHVWTDWAALDRFAAGFAATARAAPSQGRAPHMPTALGTGG